MPICETNKKCWRKLQHTRSNIKYFLFLSVPKCIKSEALLWTCLSFTHSLTLGCKKIFFLKLKEKTTHLMSFCTSFSLKVHSLYVVFLYNKNCVYLQTFSLSHCLSVSLSVYFYAYLYFLIYLKHRSNLFVPVKLWKPKWWVPLQKTFS